jgi:hypothetical protein
MGSGAMIDIPGFIKEGSDVQKLTEERRRLTHRQRGDLISLLLFFQNKENRLSGLLFNTEEIISPIISSTVKDNMSQIILPFKWFCVKRCCAD